MNNTHIIATTWNSFTVEQRKKLILKDASMGDTRWNDLVKRMSEAKWEQLTPIQRDGVIELFKY